MDKQSIRHDQAESAHRPYLAVDGTLSDWLDWIAGQLALSWPEQVRQQLDQFIQLLRSWNEHMNLTTVIDNEGIAIRHLMDSLTLLPHLDRQAAARCQDVAPAHRFKVIDVGTGAGFPGVPLAIMRPCWDMMLLDALAKRLRYLDDVIGQLHLGHTRTWHARAEDAGQDIRLRGQFDAVVARAVAPLPVLAEYCLPLAAPGGAFWAMKGNPDTEWPAASRAVTILGGELAEIHTFCLPGTDMQRSIFEFRKVRQTPSAYPRKAGKPERTPLV